MKRLFGGSCFGLLLILMLGGAAALFVFSIVFNQTQAVTSNATATIAARVTATTRPMYTARPALVTPSPQSNDTVTIQTDTESTPTAQPTAAFDTNASTPEPSATFIPTATPTPVSGLTATDAPRHSGTSSYPLTVTAEVMLAQTNVAAYQDHVWATRTAIAAESETIFATLTASAPMSTGQRP